MSSSIMPATSRLLRESLIEIPLSEHASSSQSADNHPFNSKINHLGIKTLIQSENIVFGGSKAALTCKGLALIGNILGRWSFLPVSTNLGGSNYPLSLFFGAMSFVNFVPYMQGIAVDLINTIILQIQTAEDVGGQKRSLLTRTCTVSFNLINGVCAQLPFLMQVWLYNPSRPYIVSFNALDLVEPCYSASLLTKRIQSFWCASQTEKNLLAFKEDLITMQYGFLSEFTSGKNADDTLLFLEDLKTQPVSPQVKFNNLMHYILQKSPELATSPQQPSSSQEQILNLLKQGWQNKESLVLGTVLTAYQLFWTWKLCELGFDKTKVSEEAIYATCTYVLVLSSMLLGTLMFSGSEKFTTGVHNIIYRKANITFISERLTPTSSKIAKLACLALSPLSSICAITVSRDYLPPGWDIASSVFYGTGFTFMCYMYGRKITDWVAQALIARKGSIYQKQQLLFYRQLLQFIEFSSAASPQSVMKFVRCLDSSSELEHLLRKHEIPSEDFTSTVV